MDPSNPAYQGMLQQVLGLEQATGQDRFTMFFKLHGGEGGFKEGGSPQVKDPATGKKYTSWAKYLKDWTDPNSDLPNSYNGVKGLTTGGQGVQTAEATGAREQYKAALEATGNYTPEQIAAAVQKEYG